MLHAIICLAFYYYFSFYGLSSTMETVKSLQCPFCTDTRGSRRALNRHVSWHRRSQREETGNDVRRVVLKNPEATTIAEGRGASALRDPLVASSSSSPTRQQERRNQCRKRIDAAVLRLKQQHQRDRTTLARPTEELAQWLVAADREVPWLTCVGIAVAAKHFAGTYSPRRKVTGPTAKQRPPPPKQHELHTVRRHLFQDDPAEPTSMGSAATAPSDFDTSRSVRGHRKQLLEDEEWRIDIWRSYGSKETSPPSPFGCQQSPSWALAAPNHPARSDRWSYGPHRATTSRGDRTRPTSP